MDMHTAQRLSGKRWQIAKLAALLCFVVACGLLVSSLTATSGLTPAGGPLPAFAAGG
jgi:hypothetical protein